MRTDSQVVRVSVAKVDELILDRLRDLRPLHDAIHRVLRREHVVDVGAVDCALDVGLERWLDLFREEFLPVDCAMRQPAELDGKGKGRKTRTALEEWVLLDLLGAVGPQPALRITTQQPCDEIVRLLDYCHAVV